MEYKVSGDHAGGWEVSLKGERIAFVQGPSSALVALAAAERLNQDKGFHDGWLGRLLQLTGQCTYPNCKCIVGTSTTSPEPVCPKGLKR